MGQPLFSGWIRQDYAFSERRACGVMTMAVSSYRYQTRRNDEPLRTRLVQLAREKPRYGYRRMHVLLRCGERVNHKRLHRVYREAGLMIRRPSLAPRAPPSQLKPEMKQQKVVVFLRERK